VRRLQLVAAAAKGMRWFGVVVVTVTETTRFDRVGWWSLGAGRARV
jgi:hypothetical protein